MGSTTSRVTHGDDEILIRSLRQDDFFWLRTLDCAPSRIEHEAFHLLFCVHFADTSFVAESHGDRPLGFVFGFVPARRITACSYFLFVDAEARRRGIGTELMRSLMTACRRKGARRIMVCTTRGEAFFAKLGFKRGRGAFNSRIDHYVRTHKNAVCMIRSLRTVAKRPPDIPRLAAVGAP